MAYVSPSTTLLSIDAARRDVVREVTAITGQETLPLDRCRGRILARDMESPRALPVFDHSAMDGYAVCGLGETPIFKIVKRIGGAGGPHPQLAPGEALRIVTGAPVPPGAQAIAMQEHVRVAEGAITLMRALVAGENIRRAGEDVASAETLAPAGALLDTRHIALAAAAGFAHLDVVRQLRVALASTGDELVTPSSPLSAGQLYDCQRPMLVAALERPALAITDLGILHGADSANTTFFREIATEYDLVLMTGGACIGDGDHLARALREAGGAVRQMQVAIRPGKPFTIGHIAQSHVAIMPGNPFASLVAGLLFVRAIVDQLLGLPQTPFAPLAARARFTQKRAPTRTEFMPAHVVGRDDGGLPIVDILGRGGSARLKPLIAADGLAVVAPAPGPVQPGDIIGFLPFGAAFSL